MVSSYLNHEEVACRQSSKAHFEPALKVFTRQEFTVLLEGHTPAEQPSVTLEEILTILMLLKDRLNANKK